MLTSLRIQNFRSIRDASVKLGQVNLFIGPNNSGKSNFLKGISENVKRISDYPSNQEISIEWFEKNLTRSVKLDFESPPKIQLHISDKISEVKSCETDYSIQLKPRLTKNETSAILKAELINNQTNYREELDLSIAKPEFQAFPVAFYRVWEQLKNCVVYKIEPSSFYVSVPLSHQPVLDANGANIANFINNLSQNHETLFTQLKRDFSNSIGNLISISTPPDPIFNGNLKLKFFDSSNDSFWADEVSEGVLYFLALLCIVHQPDPPKLLLLEEPEKGIHPRRIKEVMDFIFELARLRDIQIILTSHSPYVVDHFADIPECISVFDRKDGETVIRNAADIIKETNDKLEAAGQGPIHYTDALGEYWVSGFLGGVPL